MHGLIEAAIDTKNTEIFESLLRDRYLNQCLRFYSESAGSYLVQEVVYVRWKAGVRFLVAQGVDLNYHQTGQSLSCWWSQSPLEIVLGGFKGNVAPEDDNVETDRFITQLLRSHGAVRWKGKRLIEDTDQGHDMDEDQQTNGKPSMDEEDEDEYQKTDGKQATDEYEVTETVNRA
jgi:hypothetical protein